MKLFNKIKYIFGEKRKKYKCPCCGYYTFDQQTPGTDEICKVCFWQDDLLQYEDIYFEAGPNNVNLLTARKNYKKYGASKKRWISHVRSLKK